MKQIFPIEIVENTTHIHWFNRKTTLKSIYLVIIIVLIAIIVCLPFIYVDVSSQSRSTIRTPHENNSLQSSIYAQVVKSEMEENKFVQKGDTLLWLKSDELNEQILRLRQKQSENNLFIEDINSLLTQNSTLKTSKYIAEKALFKAKVEEQQIAVGQYNIEYETSKTLFEKGVESKYEHSQVKSKHESAKALLKSIQDQQYSLWQAEKTRLEQENKDLNSEILQLQNKGDSYFITAPITGNVVQYIGLQTGNFISPSQTIAYITPQANLIAECYVSPNDIGYIHKGQDVRFQMDAFNYQQWGLLHGKVTEIISDIVQVENKSFFRVRCQLEKDHLTLKNGYRGDLKKGMSGTARFFLTRRSLAELLFDEIDNWLNPQIIDNGN